MSSVPDRPQGLQKLDPSNTHTFSDPVKRINEGNDVAFFLTSKAYTDVVTFILQLNASMFPRKDYEAKQPHVWQFGDNATLKSPAVEKLAKMLTSLLGNIEQAPPDTGPRRFGNVAYRTWHDLLEADVDQLLHKYLPTLEIDDDRARCEFKAYLLGSFGSKQRLDYGTGHELSFLAFLAGIWKLGGFKDDATSDGSEERAIVLGLIEPYLALIRKLIMTYTLEPAGSHGVWGLDDHSFIPYIFGSAQLGPAIADVRSVPTEGSVVNAPDPGDVVKADVVERERKTNMYFSAIGFIYDVKKGPFWEHSPMLYDISGIRAGWAKINKGMLKMYIAEVLSKFPVVQHFPFGGLFQWERDPSAAPPPTTAHSSNASSTAQSRSDHTTVAPTKPAPNTATSVMPATKAPWASAEAAPASSSSASNPTIAGTRAPWAATSAIPQRHAASPMAPTRAPWAKDR